MNRITSTLLTAALAAGAGVGLVSVAGDAAATGTPTPWVTNGQSTDGNAVGGLTFFDANGNQITSGPTNSAPFAAYTVALGTPRADDPKTTMSMFTPEVGKNPGAWSQNDGLGVASTFPNTTAPEPVKSTTKPVYTATSGDQTLEDIASTYPQNSTQAGYVNTYELRLYTSRPGVGVSSRYAFADITIDTTAHRWSLVFTPDAPAGTATTSTLVADKTSVDQGGTVHLTDTVAPGGAKGTVQFKDGSATVGSPVAVANGKAEVDVIPSTSGAHSYTAVFTPAALSDYGPSTSSAVTVQVNKVVQNTSVALAVNPTTAAAYSNVTLTATVTPSIAGVVKFADGGAQIGQAAVTASNNVAALAYNGFAQGTHHVTATFTPTDTGNYNAATSAVVDHVASAPAGPAPDDQPITVDVPAGSLAITTPYTADHPLDVGQMKLNDNGTLLSASKQFGDKTFAKYTSGPDGTGSIQVVDTRAGNGNWTVSAQSRDLGNGSGGVINAQNVGLTGLTAVPLDGNALTAAKLVTRDNPAGNGVAAGDVGTAGLGGQAHELAHTTGGGNGSIGIWGVLTINAPTSTKAGHYTGIVTFTVMGSTTGS